MNVFPTGVTKPLRSGLAATLCFVIQDPRYKDPREG